MILIRHNYECTAVRVMKGSPNRHPGDVLVLAKARATPCNPCPNARLGFSTGTPHVQGGHVDRVGHERIMSYDLGI